MKNTALLVSLLILLPLAQNLKTNIYCVSENRSCNVSLNDNCVECQPLMWFVNRTHTIPSNSTIIFLPGEHNLNSNKNQTIISFFNKDNLTLKGIGSTKKPSTVLCSGGQSGFLFRNSSNITVSNLRFQDCGANMTDSFSSCVFFDYSYHVNMSLVFIRGCKGFGLFMNNVCGRITIKYSQFSKSKDGNAVFRFKHCREATPTYTPLYVYRSQFLDGESKTQNATGINLIILRRNVTVWLRKLKLKNNRGRIGGNVAIMFLDFAQNTSSVAIEDCHIQEGYTRSAGGGMIMKFEKTWQSDLENCSKQKSYKTVLKVTNTIFSGNTAEKAGGGVLVTYHERPGTGCTIRQVEFSKCNFTSNNAGRGGAIEISKHNIPIYMVHNAPQFSVTLKDCLIENNSIIPKGDQTEEEGIVEVFSVENFVISNSKFMNNNGTALMLASSGVQFQKETLFINNKAEYGGAIKLCDTSVMYFDNYTRVKFLSNTAHGAGGAIYAGNQCLRETPPCFFQISFNFSDTPPTIKEMADDILYFEGNQVGLAGHAIYGGSVDNCFTDTKLRFNSTSNENFYNSQDLFKRIFHFSNRSEISLVTSDPYGVCLCDITTNITNCTQRELSLAMHAGELFIVYVSAVGQTNGPVPSKILLDSSDKHFKVEKRNRGDEIYNVFCHALELVILPENNVTDVTFKLGVLQDNAVSESSTYYRIPKLTVNVEILPCPFLFELNETNSCDCPKPLKNEQVRCDISTRTVIRPDYTKWIGCILNTNTTTNRCGSVSVSSQCQKDRCSHNTVLNSTNLSEVCVEGREGRICGKCKSKYSLSLGPLKCIPTEEYCSTWRSLLLVLVFLLAGILLVCFISILNLTIAEGTINGLLFYANCIHANQELYYLSHGVNSFFRVFISWLNLDFGFQACFYSGMTAYQKIWLEFGFLFYIFLLGALIVCLSRTFIWFTRLTGRNMVPVLATITMIAYPKLVRNSIKVWHCHNDKYWSSDNSTPWIWHSDETVDCFAWKHIILFVLSILLFGVAFLYTLCLLFIQCLQRGSSWCVLRWVNKLRPFFDANTGPCRDHYCFWPGFLLFARLLLYFSTSWGSKSNKSLVLLGICVLTFFLACVSPHGVYKKWPLNLLEFSFFLNLAVATAPVAANYHHHLSGQISMAVAIFNFLLILIYHTYKRLRETRRWKRMVTKIQERRMRRRITKERNSSENPPSETSSLIQIRPGQGMPPVVDFIAPREPILEDD